MLHLKSLLAGLCLMLTFFSNTSNATTLKVLLRYNGNPICGWDVTLFTQSGGDWSHAVSDADGLVVFPDLNVIREGLDIKGVKKTKDGEKSWKFMDFIKYDKKVNFGDMNGTYDDTYVILNFETAIRDQYGNPSNVENSWGLTPAYNDCGNKTGSDSGSSKIENENSSDLLKDVKDMHALQNEMQADRKTELEQQNAALKQKIDRLNQRVEKTKTEQQALTPGTIEHSNKSYDLRDLEIERDIAELELDRNLDEQSRMGQGQLSKSDRQRYSDKTDALTAEQKQLAKNRKDGLMYGQKPLSKEEAEAKEKANKQEKEEEEPAFKIYTSEELANMSSFDLKRTKLSNNQSISKRKVRLKTKAAFLSQDEKTKTQIEIDNLTKQVDAIQAVLEKRNEKEE